MRIDQTLNALLRLASLVAKLVLTLYIGRYFSLADFGLYGLVTGTVMILTTVIGCRFDYVVSRDLVGASSLATATKMRNQAAFYVINFLIVAFIMAVIACNGAVETGKDALLAIYVLSVVESLANMTYNNLNSMQRPLLANLLFFLRSGFWALAATAIGLAVPALRTPNVLFVSWALGSIASLAVTFWIWRHLPWRTVLKTPIDWHWVKKGIQKSFFIWLGALGGTAGTYVDRFIIAHDLSLDLSGVATFYASFTMALYLLTQSGVVNFSYPRLIKFHQHGDADGFHHEAKKLGWHIALFAGFMATGIGIVVPYLGGWLHRPALVSEAPTLWLMLFGAWMASNASTPYNILFARHQDRAIWLGDLIYLFLSFGLDAILVPLIGFIGIGYGAVAANIFVLVWRWWNVYKNNGVDAGISGKINP